ncbi:signal peptidase II [Armatimonas sp.]|uniref:signal peptidase II n=1 Tax=Armatimonas sp. TaxID=1872638 RepID=UPI00286BFE9C|nr:signal peptidase II [Armatimonas sp.]
MPKRLAPAGFYLLAGVIAVSDQVVKALVKAQIPLHTSVPLWPGVFHLTHVQNDGIAFSMLAGKTWLITIASLLIMTGIVLSERRTKGGLDRFTGVALALPLGGALGNLIDRLRSGLVTDFLDFRAINFAIFNVADTAITTGICLLAIRSFLLSDPSAPPSPPQIATEESA